MAGLGNGDPEGSESPRASCPVRGHQRHAPPRRACGCPDSGTCGGPSGLGSSAMILPGAADPEAGKQTWLSCPRAPADREKNIHEAQRGASEGTGQRTHAGGYHELDHRPAFNMARPVTAPLPPNAWDRGRGASAREDTESTIGCQGEADEHHGQGTHVAAETDLNRPCSLKKRRPTHVSNRCSGVGTHGGPLRHPRSPCPWRR